MRREVDPDVACPQAALVDEETARKAQLRLERFQARYRAQQLLVGSPYLDAVTVLGDRQ